ncbi:MAG: glycoside hydrolase family 108 protein [Nitrosotalea sp.]
MNSFDIAYHITMEQEGGLVDNPKDPGGITNRGISLRFLQGCNLKYDFDRNGIVDDREIRNLTDDQAKSIYKEEFFLRLSCHLIHHQSIINYLFDTGVNCGTSTAIKILQRALCACLKTIDVKIDGILGLKTLRMINDIYDTEKLITAMRSERAGYYRSLNNKTFIDGWLKRAYTLNV